MNLSDAKAAVRRSRLTARAGGLLRRVIGTSPGQEQQQQQRLKNMEAAVGDLIPALQEVQGPRLGDVDGRLRTIETHLPQLLNTISSGHGMTRRLHREFEEVISRERDLAQSLTDLWTRIEMIRRELMVEMRYGNGVAQARSTVEPKVLDDEKLRLARASGLRINLGCGHIPLPEYVNIDMRDLPGVDVIAPIDDLPFEPGEVLELFSSHLVEHFPQEQFERQVLPYWISMIQPGGTLRAILPDAGSMLEGFANGTISYDDLREVLYGGQEYEGDFHFNMYTAESLSEILATADLEAITVEAIGRRNGSCLEMQIAARRPQ